MYHIFNLSFDKQPIAHTDGIWNFLGMLLAGFGCVLLGGCPLRQLVLAGEGNSDSAITVRRVNYRSLLLPIILVWLLVAMVQQ